MEGADAKRKFVTHDNFIALNWNSRMNNGRNALFMIMYYMNIRLNINLKAPLET